MALIEGIDPRNIADAGWGLLLPADLSEEITDEIRKNLQPLLRLRRKQAGGLYREYFGPQGVLTGETKTGWLSRNGANAVGPVDPRRAPYYLLIAAPPELVPYSFQRNLDIQYAVGRVWFDTPEQWHAYAQSAARAEEGEADRPARLAVFAPIHSGDFFTREISLRMLALAQRLQGGGTQWSVKTSLASEARLDALVNQLAADAPAVLVAAGHSLLPAPGETPAQAEIAGALVCADWAGPGSPVGEGMFFSAAQAAMDAGLNGMVYFQYSSFSAAIPGPDGLDRVTRLPQALLARPGGRGALAVVGWTGQVWSYSDPGQAKREQLALESVLRRLMDGYPVGAALESFHELYSEITTEVSVDLEEIKYVPQPDLLRTAGELAASANTRGVTLVGDPASRLRLRSAVAISTASEDQLEQAFSAPVAPIRQPALAGAISLTLRLAPDPTGRYQLGMLRSEGKTVEQTASAEVEIDFDRLSALVANPEAYGESLTDMLFHEPAARDFFNQAMHRVTFPSGQPLRVLLTLPAGDSRLYPLEWERLRNPFTGEVLATSAQVIYSQSFEAAEAQPVRQRQKRELRALVAVSAPSNLSQYGRSPTDRGLEIKLAYQVLAPIQVTVLNEPVTLQKLETALMQGYDILYLACHIALRNDGKDAGLLFERPEGSTQVVSASSFAGRIADMKPIFRPGLVALVPPDGSGHAVGALPWVSSALLGAGVSAVTGFLSPTGSTTQGNFLRAFFSGLRENGQVDQAAAEGRAACLGQPDAWTPVLYSRLPDGQFWAEPAEPEPIFGEPGRLPDAELDIWLKRQGVADFALTLSFLDNNAWGTTRIDFSGLQSAGYDPQKYGTLLFKNLFADQTLLRFYRKAVDLAKRSDRDVRLRLVADPGAPELHDLRWECLYDPDAGITPAQDPNLALARYISSTDWRSVLPGRPRGELRALAVLANPANLEEFKLHTFSREQWDGWIDFSQMFLKGVETSLLASGHSSEPVTLEALVARLREGYDLVWLDTQALVSKGETFLVMENKERRVDLVSGRTLADQLRGLTYAPRLVALGAAVSVPVGLHLAEAGVPAVLAQNGYYSVRSFKGFLMPFFQELIHSGQADRAAAIARREVAERRDWWMPALLLRVRNGRLW